MKLWRQHEKDVLNYKTLKTETPAIEVVLSQFWSFMLKHEFDSLLIFTAS